MITRPPILGGLPFSIMHVTWSMCPLQVIAGSSLPPLPPSKVHASNVVKKIGVVSHLPLSPAARKPTSLLWPDTQHAAISFGPNCGSLPRAWELTPLSLHHYGTVNTITNIFRLYWKTIKQDRNGSQSIMRECPTLWQCSNHFTAWEAGAMPLSNEETEGTLRVPLFQALC